MHLQLDLKRLDELSAALGGTHHMGAPLPTLPPLKSLKSIARRLLDGIKTYSLENLEKHGPYLAYCGVSAVVHLWSFENKDLEQVCNRKFRDKRYHVTWCPVINNMYLTGKFNARLMYSRRTGGLHRVEETISGRQVIADAHFPVCRSCLRTIGRMSFWTMPWARSDIVKKFDLDEFLKHADTDLYQFPREALPALPTA